jgi:O-antigen ligase
MTKRAAYGGVRTLFPYLELGLALAAAALWYSTGGAVWFRETAIGLWPVALVAALWPLHWGARKRRHVSGRAGYTLWLALFLLSAGASVWAAYDRQIALAKFGLILGAVGLAAALAHQPTRRHLYVALGVLAAVAACLGAFFILTNDWAAQPVKVPLLSRLGVALSSALPDLRGHRITPNVVGGMLAALLPLAVALVSLRPRAWLGSALGRWARAMRAMWASAAAVATLAFLLSVSRGAWLGLGAGALLWGLWRWVAGEPVREPEGWRRQVIAGGLLCAALALAALLAGYALLTLGLPGADALAGRLALWRDGLLLAQDYAYTGVGMGLFSTPFSVYTLLIHVGYIVYSHNMWIDILAEQGVFGVAALALLMGTAVAGFVRWRRVASKGLGRVMEACLVSIVAMTVHGMFDNVLYGSRGVLILFTPYGIMMAATALAAREGAHKGEQMRRQGAALAWLGPPAVVIVALLAISLGRPAAAWHANLGAVAQTQAELQVYDPLHFDNPDLDQVRKQVDLADAQTRLERAARWPGHPTARRRLAAIALAQGDYERALALMQVAWDAGRRDAPTRLLYGDALVANGYVAEAARVIAGLAWAAPRLEGQAWSRYWVHEDWERAAYAYEAVALLQPGQGGAEQRAADARRRAGLPPLEP